LPFAVVEEHWNELVIKRLQGREIMGLRSGAVAGPALGFVLMACAADAQVLTQKDVSARMAWTIIEAATAQCEKDGYSITIAVLDRVGRFRAYLQGDKASLANIELARRKAYTALTFRRTSLDWAQRTAEGSNLAGQRSLTDVIPLGGGIPIKIGDETIGAIGVSGAPGQDKDETCAMAGLAKVADQLK
jgi:uncharacterized protein GlcG (DUF336 family)